MRNTLRRRQLLTCVRSSVICRDTSGGENILLGPESRRWQRQRLYFHDNNVTSVGSSSGGGAFHLPGGIGLLWLLPKPLILTLRSFHKERCHEKQAPPQPGLFFSEENPGKRWLRGRQSSASSGRDEERRDEDDGEEPGDTRGCSDVLAFSFAVCRSMPGFELAGSRW